MNREELEKVIRDKQAAASHYALEDEVKGAEKNGDIFTSSGIRDMLDQPEAAPDPASDCEMLAYLMERFDAEEWNCPVCGHAESTSNCDSADALRKYLSASDQPEQPLEMVAQGEPSKALPYNPTEQMMWAMKTIDPALTIPMCRDLYCAAWSAFRPAPAQDERAAFEGWWNRQAETARNRMPGDDWLDLNPDDFDQYESAFEAGASWQARAALAQPKQPAITYDQWFQSQQGVAYDGMWSFAKAAWQAALAQQGEDARRLDYLQERGATVRIVWNAVNEKPDFEIGGLHFSRNTDIRAAIDAAALAGKEQS